MPNCPRTPLNVESRGLPSSEKDWYKVSRRKPAPWATVVKPLDLTTLRSATSKSLSSPSSRTASKYAAISSGLPGWSAILNGLVLALAIERRGSLYRIQRLFSVNSCRISVTVSMISAGRGSSSSPNSARTACQSGSIGSASPASSIIRLIRAPWPAATARINDSVKPGRSCSWKSLPPMRRACVKLVKRLRPFATTSQNIGKRMQSVWVLRCQFHSAAGALLGLRQTRVVILAKDRLCQKHAMLHHTSVRYLSLFCNPLPLHRAFRAGSPPDCQLLDLRRPYGVVSIGSSGRTYSKGCRKMAVNSSYRSSSAKDNGFAA